MEISGSLRANCAPEVLVATLTDVRALNRLLPEGSKIEDRGEGQYGFTVSRTFGPIRLTLPGILSIQPGERPHDRRMHVKAAHVIGGKVELEVTFQITPDNGATRVSYAGDLEASGLAGRIAREQRGRINTVVKGAMTRLKHLAEARARQEASPPGAPQA